MENEIEIKLIVSKNIEKSLSELVGNQSVKVVNQQHELANIYFDTDKKLLRQWDMGLRVRVNGSHIEQTIKTAGQVIGGLHQRPEYNINITNKSPDLSLFPNKIWPDDCDLKQLQLDIKPLFSTDFSRKSMMMIYQDGSVVDLVYDSGFISNGSNKVEICEVELELVKGNPQLLFNLAEQLAQLSPVRFGTISKAARGYQLANDTQQSLKTLELTSVVAKESLESAYIKTVSYGLSHWQYHVELFIENGNYQALKEVRQGLQLIIKANEIYQDYLVETELKSMTKDIFWLMEQLSFVDNYIWCEELLANNGHKFKRLDDHKKIKQLLEQQRDTQPSVDYLTDLFSTHRHTKLVSRLIQWLYFKPWQQQTLGSTLDKFQNTPLRSVAKQFLEQDWEALQQNLPYENSLSYQDYLAQRQDLQHNLQVGICVGNIFDQQRLSCFRAPWIDIGTGIDQLLQFEPIRKLLRDNELLDDGGIKQWLKRKEESLIGAMELSRKSALKLTPYWT